jgi:chitodextrinase
MRQRLRRLTAVGGVLSAVVAGTVAIFSTPALAATTTCTTAALISAITSANSSNGTVTLTSGCTYTLTAVNNTTDSGGVGLPVITGKVTIQGSGATIARSGASGTPTFRIFDVASAGSLTLNSVTISNGLANNGQQGGGGIFNHGTLTVTGSTFTGNSAPATTGTSGGGIDNSGTLNVSTSTFTGNTAQEGGAVFNQKSATIATSTFTGNTATIYGGGALLNAAGTMTVTGSTFTGNTGPGGGAIDNDTTLNISNSTFTGNTGGTNGGGAIDNFGSITVTQSTFSGNSSPYGANILNYTGYTLKISMSIVANGQGGGPNCGGGQPVTDAGYNLDSGTSCGFSTANHSLNTASPNLGPLANNGGSTQTMALPAGSPAVDTIPASTSGCKGTTDQRGTNRPQGTGCDAGAYELVQSGSGTPSVPAGLNVTGTTSSSVSLSWNASTGSPTGYTVYRAGKAVGTTGGPNATTYTDLTASPSTTYTYTVDAFSGSNHSAQSAPVQAITRAPGTTAAVQAGSVSTASQVTSATITLSAPVQAGDLLVGWFGEYNSSGQVKVSDSVNGAWTRSTASTTFGGGGDIALYYLQNTAAAPNGLIITISATNATYLESAAGEYSGVATAGALDQVAAAKGNSATVDSGPTGAVGAGELVVGGILTGGSPGTVMAGTSQGQSFALRAQTSGQSANLEDILSSAAGAQDARATFSSATDWYAVAATFHPYGSGNTSPPSVPAGLAAPSVTASSVGLSWSASTDATGTLAGYTVYRNGTSIGTVNAGTTTFTDSAVQPSTAYSYTVDAFDTAGNHSAQSPALPVTTPAAAASPPTVPAGLAAPSVTASSVGLSWSASTDATGTLAGYTVYRNGTSIGTAGAGTTTFTDSAVQPSTAYSYTVDAFDTAGNHSAQSPALPVTTPAAAASSVKWVQGGVVGTGTKVTITTITFSKPVSAGDLLVGWFGQYDSSGQVSVSDNVNGAWTRSSAATKFGSSGKGDIALFYVQNAAAAPTGLIITISATNATYLQAAAADYSGVATTGALDQVAVAKGNSTAVDSGPTAAVGAGELVVGGIMTGGSPGSATAGSSQGQAFTMRSQTGSGSIDLEDIPASAAGAQDARATFSSATDWYAVAAVFHHA